MRGWKCKTNKVEQIWPLSRTSLDSNLLDKSIFVDIRMWEVEIRLFFPLSLLLHIISLFLDIFHHYGYLIKKEKNFRNLFCNFCPWVFVFEGGFCPSLDQKERSKDQNIKVYLFRNFLSEIFEWENFHKKYFLFIYSSQLTGS